MRRKHHFCLISPALQRRQPKHRKVERLSKHHTAGTWQNTVRARWPQPGAQAPETTSWCITHSCPQGTCPKSPLDTQGKLEEGVPRQGDYNPTLQMGRQRTRRAKLVARDCTESELPTISTQWISVCPVLCLQLLSKWGITVIPVLHRRNLRLS